MASIIDHNGVERKLGLLPLDEQGKQLRAAQPTFSDFLSEKGMVVYQSFEWEERDNFSEFGNEFVLDQHQSSGCVGWSEAAAEMKVRARRGMPFEILSGAFTYAHINGGRDEGAQIVAAMTASRQYGHALKSEFDYPKIFLNQIPDAVKESALTRQSTLAYTINSREEFFTALMLGFVVQHGVTVGGNFNNFDQNGFAGFSGGYANHSVHSFGCKMINNVMCPLMGNTWGPWGPWRNGNCYLQPRAVLLDDAFVHVDSEWRNDQ